MCLAFFARHLIFCNMKNSNFKFLLFFFPFFLIVNCLFSQNSFDILISTENDELLHDVIELNNGNFVAVGSVRDNYYYTTKAAFVVEFDLNGNIVNSITNAITDTFYYASAVIQKNDGNILVIGTAKKDTIDKIFIFEYDSDLHKIHSKYFVIPKPRDLFFAGLLKKSNQNLIIYGGFHTPSSKGTAVKIEPFFIEINQNLDSIGGNYILSEHAFNPIYSLAENQNNTGYYALTRGSYMSTEPGIVLYVDNTYTIESYKDLPNLIFKHGALKMFSDTSYVVVSMKVNAKQKTQNDDIAVLVLDTAHNVIHETYLGTPDTSDQAGYLRTMDFIDKNNIYIAGTHGFQYTIPLLLGNYQSFILIVKVDSFLNTTWERFYGGDANYQVESIRATTDGGCLVLATRYDYLTQNEERDAVILKLDSQGNLPVSVSEIPDAKMSELIIYPNPGTAEITVRTASQALGGEFILCDILGKQVFQTSVKERFTPVSTNTLPEGVYVFKYILNGKIKETGKWLKAKK